MKKDQGVSLIALIIMIIIMVIIAGIALTAGFGSYDKALEAKNKEERHQVQNAVSTRFGEYTMNSSLKPLLGEQIPGEYFLEDDPDARIQAVKTYLVGLFVSEGRLRTDDEINNHTIVNEIDAFLKKNYDQMEYTRIIRHSHIIELGIDSIALPSVFLVNYYSADVIGPIQ